MAGQPGFFDGEERLKASSAAGDPLERLAQVIDFEGFRDDLEAALSRSDRAKGGRPPYDAVLMFKAPVLQTLYTLSDDQTEYQLKDRLSFMRFVGLALHDPVPDAKTIWLYRVQLARAGTAERLFARFDALLRAKGWLAMGGQIVDATVIQARRPRLTQAEKDTLKGGGTPAEWTPARRAQIDRDGRWTIKRGRKRQARPGQGNQRQVEIAVARLIHWGCGLAARRRPMDVVLRGADDAGERGWRLRRGVRSGANGPVVHGGSLAMARASAAKPAW